VTKQETLASVCRLLSSGRIDDARDAIRCEYPLVPPAAVKRQYGDLESVRVFMRDGFIDRYSGDRLVFPGALRLISSCLPEVFPYHPNWKMTETHIAYWELSPTVDHVVPVARGGPDREDNWATTSMLRNSAKANWLLEELGWTLRPIEVSDWDGLAGWFREYVSAHPDTLNEPAIRKWNRALTVCGVVTLHDEL
jgi:hypothetical protein